MKSVSGRLKSLAEATAKKATAHKGLLLVAVVVFFISHIYFVRELVAAELLFGLAFAVLIVLGGICYVLGMIGEWSLDVGEASVRVIGHSARRGYNFVDHMSRKSIRHPHPERAR